MADSFAAFAEERGKALYRYGYLLAGNAYDADDLVQKALLRTRDRWPQVAEPEAYTRATMARLHVRKGRRRETPTSDTGLWAQVAGLPARERAILVLRYHEGLDDQRIADVLGLSLGTVRRPAALDIPLDQDLTGALAEASRVHTPDDIPTRVELRAQLRRRRRIALAGAVLSLSVLALLLRSMGTPTAVHPSPPPSPATSTMFSAAPSPLPGSPPPTGPLSFPPSTSDLKAADEVWPAAIVRFARPPGYVPVGVLDGDHVLVTSDDRDGHAARLYAYDRRNGSAAPLADLADPPGARGYTTRDFAVTPTEILWWGHSDETTHVWSLARSGGAPQQVAAVPGALDLAHMSAFGEAVYWSGANTGGVYRLDRRTREMAVLPGLEGFRLTVFPWAISPDRAPVLHNVLTNEEIVVRAPADTGSLWCVPAMCVGEGGPAFSHFAMRPNGTHRVDLMDADLRPGLAGGRYAVAVNRASGYSVLIDVETGQAGRLAEATARITDDAIYWSSPTPALFLAR